MRAYLTFFATLALAPVVWAQGRLDTCKIFIWDNDAGECAQDAPAMAMNYDEVTLCAFADMRDKNWNVYGQVWTKDTVPGGGNFLVNQFPEYAYGKQMYPSVGCAGPSNQFVVVWQDSSPPFWTGYPNRWHIAGRKVNINGVPVTDQKKVTNDTPINGYFPKVAVNRESGNFVVVWNANMTPISRGMDIYARLFSSNFDTLTGPILVNDDASNTHQLFPDVAFSDSGIIIVWQDNRGGEPLIFAQRYKPNMDTAGLGGNYPIWYYSGYAPQYRPSVSASTNGKYAVAWRNADSTVIRGKNTNWDGSTYDAFTVASVVSPFKCFSPDVAMMHDSAFVYAWHHRNSSGYDFIKAKFYEGYMAPWAEGIASEYSLRSRRAPCLATFSHPPYHNSKYFALAWFDSLREEGRGDIFGQYYRVFYTSQQVDSIKRWGQNYRIDNLRANGRKVWYFPKKNFDNPATTGWNEDPIAEPDSMRIPLDSAFVRAFAERNNVPGQQFVVIADTDTLMADVFLDRGGTDNLNDGDYDLCVLDLGYAEDGLGAGEISDNQQDSIMKFSDEGGALLCSGGDFGQMYDGTMLYDDYFAANYDGPGNPMIIGNIDSLGGMPGTFTQGMMFHYPFQEEPDNSIDFISPGSYGGYSSQTIFMSDGPGPVKWAYCRGISYAAYWKGQKAAQRSNIYIPFAMGSLISDGVYPNTQDELSRRILGFQGFNVEPAPIHDLAATAGSTEGVVEISWTAPFDDVLAESASVYQLKFSSYNSGAADLGMLSSEEDYIDSGMVYHQTWGPKSPFSAETQQLQGLPPGDTLILAMKAGDGSSPVRWSELGAEPRAVVPGDRVTPHSLGVGYGYGCVNDFVSTEQIDFNSGDTLFCTWDTANVYFGYSRCDWRTEGDLLIYLDTRSGGSDSTFSYNASGGKSAFDVGGDFKPDFCLVCDSLGKAELRGWFGLTNKWIVLGDPFSASLDSINSYEYLEAGIPFSSLANYDTTYPFRYLVVCQQEGTNDSWNAFPIENTPGKPGKTPARYPYYYGVTNGLRSGLEPAAVSNALAVELSEFSAMLSGGGVTLNWRTESETDNYQWLIERSTEPGAGYQQVAAVPGQGSSPAGHCYSFTDGTVLPDMTYYYRLGDQDLQQNVTWHGPISVYTGDLSLVREFRAECRPNPARGAVEIRFSLPRPGTVKLSVYDVAGRLVRTFGRQWLGIGRHVTRWDCADQAGRKVPSGVYFYRLGAESGEILKGRMTVIR